jgi:aerobic-type carbon monoxide dehydrogenase small subunit (CoxS/CutS family)
MVTVRVNGAPRTVDVEADTPVLWMLRDEPRLNAHSPRKL